MATGAVPFRPQGTFSEERGCSAAHLAASKSLRGMPRDRPIEPLQMTAHRATIDVLRRASGVQTEARGKQKRSLADRAAGTNRSALVTWIQPGADPFGNLERMHDAPPSVRTNSLPNALERAGPVAARGVDLHGVLANECLQSAVRHRDVITRGKYRP